MILTPENYFSPEADREYMSVSQYKSFLKCEAAAYAELTGEWQREEKEAFLVGHYVHAWAEGKLDEFIAELAGGLNLFTGPLNLQDGTPHLADGEVATDQQIWYLPQLLEGMEGQSVSE